MRTTFLALLTLSAAACAGGPAPAGSPAPEQPQPAPAATTVMRRAAEATPPVPPPQPPAPVEEDIGGSYGVSLSYGGQALDVTLQLGKRDDGTWGGSIYVDQAGTIPFNAVTVKGNVVQASLNSPDGSQVTMEFRIENGELTGAWRSSSGDGSQLRGRKLP